MTRRIQIIVLTVVWGFVLFGYSKMYNAAPPTMNASNLKDKPQLVTTFTHFCCSGCYDKVYQSAKHLDFISSADIDQTSLKKQSERDKEDVDPGGDIANEYNKDAIFYLADTEIPYLNILLADKTFRESGLIPKRMLIKNIPHFNLVALDLHLELGINENTVKALLQIEKDRQDAAAAKRSLSPEMHKMSDVNMQAFTVDTKTQKITAEYYNQADVTAFVAAIEKAGIEPQSIKIEILP